MTQTNPLIEALLARKVAHEYQASAENKLLAIIDGPCVSDEQQAEICRAHAAQEDLLEWLRPSTDEEGWRKANVQIATATGIQYAQLSYATPYGHLQIFPADKSRLLDELFDGSAVVCQIDRQYHA
jgi:hypothetical protein